jgi:hypothetical protein
VHALAKRSAGGSAPRGSVCDKQEAADGRQRSPQPTADFASSDWKRHGIGRGESRNSAARGSAIANDEQTGDAAASPSSIRSNSRGESRLAVEPVEGRLAVGDDRLDFDDQNDPRRPVECEHVDRTSLAVDRERDFDGNLPSGRSEEHDDGVDDSRVRLVKEPVELLAVPPQSQVDGGANRHGDALELRDLDVADETSVDS